ncbi:MAG: YggS family pyridoxal phosphate-dependent enzyme [Anaerolineae bacterium]
MSDATTHAIAHAIAQNLAQVEGRIEAACVRAGRQREEVTLIAVSKTRSVAEIRAALGCGVRHLGENRIEEVEPKVAALREEGITQAIWHMIGHVQSRKARSVVALCDTIHSVDSLRLAERLDRHAADLGRRVPVLLELNVSGEESKFGFCAHDEAELERFVVEAAALEGLTALDVVGLMTMAPIVPDPELARPVFRRLATVREHLRKRLPFTSWNELSMGMTDDYGVAIEEGATMVRIGRAIFGHRTEEAQAT